MQLNEINIWEIFYLKVSRWTKPDELKGVLLNSSEITPPFNANSVDTTSFTEANWLCIFLKQNLITSTFYLLLTCVKKPHTFDKKCNEYAIILLPEIICARGHNIECSLNIKYRNKPYFFSKYENWGKNKLIFQPIVWYMILSRILFNTIVCKI